MAALALSIKTGLPPPGDFFLAWVDEPLTGMLKETDVPFVLPAPDKDVSLVAEDADRVVGQCATYKAVKYWTQIEALNPARQNLSTRIFVAIHKKAVKAEQDHLAQLREDPEKALHSAGMAVLSEYRGRRLGIAMRERQIAICKENKMTTLFCSTTNSYSAATVEPFGFVKIAEYSYGELAKELDHPDLAQLNDSFTLWCLKV